MKKVICFFLSLLLLLLSGCSDAQPTETMQARPTKALEFPGGVYAKAEDMRTLLVGLVEYDADGRTVITSLNVLVCGQDGRIDMLTIPKDTRVWVEYYENENFLYNTLDSIGSVYCAAESANLGPQKMVEAVSGLLGGISMDHYVLFNAVQLQNLTQLTGNIFLNVESTIPALGIEAGYQDITPMIAEYAEYTYLKSVNGVEYTGTDLYKLERHQNLVFALMKKNEKCTGDFAK